MKKIKILRIIARLNIGGPAVHSILLTRYLNNDKFDSILVTGIIGKGEGDMMYLAETNNVNPVIIKELGREISWRDDIIAFYKILKLIIKERPDIIHTHTAKAGTLGRMAGVIYNSISSHKAYLVHTFHGHVFHGYFDTLKTKVFILIERILAWFTDKVIVISKGQANEISEKLNIKDEDKLKLIPLGLNLSPFYESEKYCGLFKKELGLDDDTKLIGIVGRLVPIKNHRMFLDSVKKYREADKNRRVKFLVVGGGELAEELKKYSIDLGITGDVIFTGWRKDLEAIYSDIDIVVMASLNEGTPVSVIEAMASGKPVISTDVGGVRDLFKEKTGVGSRESGVRIYSEGILINSDDSDSLSKGIKFLLDNPKLAEEMGENGRAAVKERFDIKRLVSDMEKMYEGLIKGG